MFRIQLIIGLLLAVALPETLAAQLSSNDSGQYVILSAQYGTARRHVDVTNRLKELARQDRIFRMGNSTFGVDPDQGQDQDAPHLCPWTKWAGAHVRVSRRQYD